VDDERNRDSVGDPDNESYSRR